MNEEKESGWATVECDLCEGEGSYLDRVCPRCGGKGKLVRAAAANQAPKGSDLPVGTKIRTEDGYVLEKFDNGTWGDGDMVFDSLDDLDCEYRVLD